MFLFSSIFFSCFSFSVCCSPRQHSSNTILQILHCPCPCTHTICAGIPQYGQIIISVFNSIVNKKNLQAHKPDSVSILSFIWAIHHCIAPAAYPPEIRTSNPLFHRNGKLRHIWHCNPQGLPITNIATYYRELLPHIFTLSPIAIGAVIFCGTFSYNVETLQPPVRWCGALCYPDFPH